MKKVAFPLLALSVGVSIAGPAFAYSKTFDDFSTVGAIGVPLVAGIITLVKDDDDGLWQLGESYAVTMGAAYALKYTIDETRPDGSDNHSFPSGHAASAFAGASYLQFRYGWKYGVPGYIVASAVAWSRVDSDHHHWRDVIASAVIANISAYFLTDRFEEKVAVVPLVDPGDGAYGLLAAVRF